MATVNSALSSEILSAKRTPTPVTLNIPVLTAFSQLVVNTFSLGPDETADIKRVPVSVKTLADLFKWMQGMMTKISAEPKTAKTDGTLRTYKFMVIAGHVMHGWLKTAKALLSKTYLQHAVSAALHGASHTPQGLSVKAQTLYDKTLTDGRSRLVMVLILMMRLSTRTVAINENIGMITVAKLSEIQDNAGADADGTAAIISEVMSEASDEEETEEGDEEIYDEESEEEEMSETGEENVSSSEAVSAKAVDGSESDEGQKKSRISGAMEIETVIDFSFYVTGDKKETDYDASSQQENYEKLIADYNIAGRKVGYLTEDEQDLKTPLVDAEKYSTFLMESKGFADKIKDYCLRYPSESRVKCGKILLQLVSLNEVRSKYLKTRFEKNAKK